MWIEYNCNPLGKKVGDCTVRAISCAMERDWDSTFIELMVKALELADMPSSNSVWGAYLHCKGFDRYVIPNECPDCYTIEDFCADYPQGVYVVATGSHAVCVKNGDYYDTWDSGSEVPAYYWKRKED